MRALVVVGIGFFLLAAACGDSAEPPGTEAPTTTFHGDTTTTTTHAATTTSSRVTTTVSMPGGPGYGGEVVFAGDQVPPTLNPLAVGGDHFVVSLLGQLVHAGVWEIEAPSLERIPELVTAIPTLANGGVEIAADGAMTVRYRLRDEAVWADGTPISGDDLAFTRKALADAGTAPEGGPDGLYARVTSEEAGPKTYALTLPAPTLQYLELFPIVLPAHQLSGTDVANDWDREPWVSAGPFELEEWRDDGTLTFTRNERFWQTDPATGLQLPYLDRVEYRPIPETSRLLDAFALREVDIVNPPPIPREMDIPGLTSLGADFTLSPGPIWEHLNFQFGPNNRNEHSWNRHLKYRRAVAHAIDRQALLEASTPVDDPVVMQSYLATFVPGLGTDAWAGYDYDPAEARRLLAELCAELGHDCAADPPRVVFSATSNGDFRVRVGSALRDMFEDAGIVYDAELEDSSLFFGETLDGGTWDVGLWAWVGLPSLTSAVAIHDVFDPDAPPPDGQNVYRWGTPAVAGAGEPFDQGASTLDDEHTERFRELLAAMRTTVDPGEVAALLQEAERLLADQVIILPLWRRLDPGVVWADEVGNYVHNPSQAGDTWNAAFWYRRDR